MNNPAGTALLLGLSLLGALATGVAGERLNNGLLTAEFDGAALVRLRDNVSGFTLDWADDSAALTVNGEPFAVPGSPLVRTRREKDRLVFTHEAGTRTLDVVYELRPGWRFIAKRLVLNMPAASTCRVDTVEVFRAQLKTVVAREHKAANASGAVFLRLGDPGPPPGHGVFLALQNPFLKWQRQEGKMAMTYPADLEWRGAYGPFESDRVCVGLHALTGIELPARAIPEWKYVAEPDQAFAGKPMLDQAEIEAMVRCVDAFALFRPTKSLRVHVPWCENDYQIDVATPAGREEWKRILDQCAAIGVDHTLFTPANSALAPLQDNADAWGWENCLWLGLGQKIRQGQWNIAHDPIPDSVGEMLDYAKSKGVKLIAYAYPTLGWKQNPEWTAWCGGKTGGYDGVDTGVRSFQDWFVDRLVAFQRRTGIAGYSFDHWWIAYEPTKDGKNPTSKYAQWFGCRRILEELRRRIPGVVIDGRQQYQWFGPWTWLAGSYPHPTTTDEQPGSFENFPDLHFSRVSADRQRFASWYYHIEQFTPWEIVPGYLTHQTPRNNAKGECVRDRPFHTRDWDLLGWRYSVLASIATAPFNHVVNLIPARDVTEFFSFRPADQRWLREWMDWTDRHRATLRNLRPIIGPPMLGRVDGTAAVARDRGFVFLFNPNYRLLEADFALDASMGLTEGTEFVLREWYPIPGRLLGAPGRGTWRRGEHVILPIKGPEALALEIVPVGDLVRPALLNARGHAQLQGDRLVLTEVDGEVGTSTEVSVLLPSQRKVRGVTVNGRDLGSGRQNGVVMSVTLPFAGQRFGHCPQVGAYDPRFDGRVFKSEFTVPRRVFDQLSARRQSWPVAYTTEELLATWRGSDRLLLFIQIAEPNDEWTVGVTLNGQAVEVKKAYSDVFPLGRERTFTGFYADLSSIKPDTRYEVEVALPEKLLPGQFQGVFFENVEAEFTRDLR